jgi:hypothetical protein
VLTSWNPKGESVYLSLPCGTTLTARCLGSGSGVDVLNGTRGWVLGLCDVSKPDDTLASVRFDGHEFDLVVPTKYLSGASV